MVVVAVSPSSAHVTAEVTKGNTVMVEIFAIVNTVTFLIHSIAVVVYLGLVLPLLVPAWVKCVK